MEAPGGIEPRTVHPPLRTRLEDEGWGRSLKIFINFGALSRTRTGTPIRQEILSLVCLPFHQEGFIYSLNKIS